MTNRRSFLAALLAAPIAAMAVYKAKPVVVRGALHRLLVPGFRRHVWANYSQSFKIDYSQWQGVYGSNDAHS